MRLLEAILEANRRRLDGDKSAMVPTGDHAPGLPLAALSCIDARLNHLLPDMLGIAEEQFVWLRNAGNIITGPMSSTTRSLALACAVKGAKEIAVIGHSDCQVCKTTVLQLLERMSALGVDRKRLPDNLVEYFGLFSSERQNVIKATETIRSSPLIGAAVPVHGLLIDVATGRLESVVNGYDVSAPQLPGKVGDLLAKADHTLSTVARIGNMATEDLKLPAGKIGEFAETAHEWLHKAEVAAAKLAPAVEAARAALADPPRGRASDPKRGNPLATLQERMRQYAAKNPGAKPPKTR